MKKLFLRRRAALGVGEGKYLMAQVPPHLALGSISREFLEIMSAQTRLLKIDATDLMIITCVAFLSTKDALADPLSVPEYNKGNNALPLEYCKGIYTKEVSFSLNMNYEITRRRLDVLVGRGYLIKEKRRFYLPYQGGEKDFTNNARSMAVNAIKRFHDIYERFAADTAF